MTPIEVVLEQADKLRQEITDSEADLKENRRHLVHMARGPADISGGILTSTRTSGAACFTKPVFRLAFQ